jgi:hypothetical protein
MIKEHQIAKCQKRGLIKSWTSICLMIIISFKRKKVRSLDLDTYYFENIYPALLPAKTSEKQK